MITLLVYGIPLNADSKKLRKARGKIKAAVPRAEGHRLSARKISVIFPDDRLKDSSERKIVTLVNVSFHVEPSDEYFRNLSLNVNQALLACFPEAASAECYPHFVPRHRSSIMFAGEFQAETKD